MSGLWFIGEAPSRITSRRGAATLDGASGRLLSEWAGLRQADLKRRARFCHLFDKRPPRWSPKLARDRAKNHWIARILEATLGPGGDKYALVVLVGARTRAAFEMPPEAPPFSWYQWAAMSLAWMPEIQGPYWQDSARVDEARRFLRVLLGVPSNQLTMEDWR